MKFDTEENKFVPDIASCDIKSLSQIECYLQNDVKWSNGEDVTTQDIILTFKILKDSGVNPIISSLLSETTIEEKERTIIFKNTKSDINFLNVLLQPIVSTSVINNLSPEQLDGKFPTTWGVYSGPYKVETLAQDENLWIKKLTLDKNPLYKKSDVFIDKISFKVFDDTAHFLKHRETVNIFNDKTNILTNSVPRLQDYQYILPQYVSVYLNTEKIPELSMRTFILSMIDRDNIVKLLSENNYKAVMNPFMSDEKMDKQSQEKNIVQIIQSKGYSKKADLVKKFAQQEEKKMSAEAPITTENSISITRSKIITSPEVNNINFISQDDVLLKGKVEDTQIEGVYINDYKLKAFKKGDSEFYYRLKLIDYETIVEWKNTYKIYFEKGWKQEFQEELVFYYYTDAKKLEDEKTKILTAPVVVTSTPLPQATSVDPNILKKLEALSDTLYYNKDLETFAYSLYYVDTDPAIGDVAQNIKQSLWQFGVDVLTTPISLSELNQMLKKGEKPYDMILAGINLGYFDYNLFPYFHSSQIKNGYNFSQFKKLSLDILLEEAKSTSHHAEKIAELEKKILEILREEQFVKTLYTPIMRNLVDKNIKNYSLKPYLYDDTLRFEWLKSAYVDEKKIINLENKGVVWFFSFLKNTLLQ